jgi:hypothetical protein
MSYKTLTQHGKAGLLLLFFCAATSILLTNLQTSAALAPLPRRVRRALRRRATTCQILFERPRRQPAVATPVQTLSHSSLPATVTAKETLDPSTSSHPSSPPSSERRWNWTDPSQIAIGCNVGNWLLCVRAVRWSLTDSLVSLERRCCYSMIARLI